MGEPQMVSQLHTDSNTTPNHDSPAAPFHSNPDILGEICEYLAPYDNLEIDVEQVSEARQNLAWLALTCKAFLEPALDRLWRSLDTLYPLFKILPAFTRADGTHVRNLGLPEAVSNIGLGPARAYHTRTMGAL